MVRTSLSAKTLFKQFKSLRDSEKKKLLAMLGASDELLALFQQQQELIDSIESKHRDFQDSAAKLIEASRATREQRNKIFALLQSRNRKSAPETIRRNVEICNLRDKDPRTWSLRRLARKYHIKWQSIQRIVKNCQHWREQARGLILRGG
jgi:hypothetical protein